MIKQFLAHIPFHMSTHHVPLISDIIFAETLHYIHNKKTACDQRQCMQDFRLILCEQGSGHSPQDLGISQIYQTDHCCTYQVNKKDRLIRTVIVNEFFDSIHKKKSFQL